MSKNGVFSRRQLLSAAAGLWLAGAAGSTKTLHAQNVSNADDEYRLGVASLRRGRRFENAIKQLEEAVRLSPARSDCWLALGCAYASRAASVASASEKIASYDANKRAFPARLQKWQDAQKDPQSPDFNTPTPTLRVLRTPDDDLSFTQTEREAAQTVKVLAASAANALDKGVALCSASKDSAVKAHAEHTRGWGLALLRKYRSIRDQNTIPHKQVIEAFTACLMLAPENAAYWHARGAGRFPLFMRDDNTDTSAHAEPAADGYREGISDLNHALLLQPKNFNVLYQLSLVTANRDEAASLSYLKKAVALKPGNAILGYYLGQRLLIAATKTADVPQQKALRTTALGVVEQAANARQFQATKVVLPVPPDLQAAWNYSDAYANNQDYGVVLFLAVQVRDYMEQERDPNEQLRWVHCLCDIGLSETRNYESADAEANTDDEKKSARYLRYGIGVTAYGLGVGFADRIKDNFKGDAAFGQFLRDGQQTLKIMKQNNNVLENALGF